MLLTGLGHPMGSLRRRDPHLLVALLAPTGYVVVVGLAEEIVDELGEGVTEGLK